MLKAGTPCQWLLANNPWTCLWGHRLPRGGGQTSGNSKRASVRGKGQRDSSQGNDQGDELYVDPTAEDSAHTVRQHIERDFIHRCVLGWQHAPVETGRGDVSGFVRDSQGLMWTESHQLVIPDYQALRKECIESVHAHPYSGHYGGNRTLQKAKQIYYWPGMQQDIELYVKCCDSCQRVKAPRQRTLGELQPLQIPGRRWESISMDLITDLPVTPRGKDAIVVFVDRLSKMCHLAACTKTVTAEGLAHIFRDKVWALHGVPQDIVHYSVRQRCQVSSQFLERNDQTAWFEA
jgi:hypothetical protein